MVNIAKGTQPTTVIILNFDDLAFKIVKNIKSSTFLLNKNGLTKMRGTVYLETTSQLLTLCIDSIEFHGYKKIMGDRSGLNEFDTEARLLIKELLKTSAKKL